LSDSQITAIRGPDAAPGSTRGAALLFAVRCTGQKTFVRGRPPEACTRVLREVPGTWHVTVRAIPARDHANGEHEVQRCDRCGTWNEIHCDVTQRSAA
jgi:uncharacterized metal-binding protein YceD (DUF177 family)